MDEKQIQKVLIQEWVLKYNHKVGVKNVFFYHWESDLLSIDKNDQVTEYEIKCSRFDYLNDVKKVEKHEELKHQGSPERIPNFFYYVYPEEIKIEDVPEYAGCIVVVRNGMLKYLKVLKKAPLLHSEKMNPERWQDLAIKLYHRLVD